VNKRLAVLEKMISAGSADAFAYYGLALEYRKEGRLGDAMATFSTLRQRDASYLPMYLMAGQILVEQAAFEAAREWLEAGIELASARGDSKTRGELESELANTR
jgi:tetratricopeptide (TPR) repeat protein